jgi:hypothetical protein
MFYKTLGALLTGTNGTYLSYSGIERTLNGNYTYAGQALGIGTPYSSSNFRGASLYEVNPNHPYTGVVFGTGDTPPTLDDYCLAGSLVSGYSCDKEITKELTDESAKVTAVYTITNTSGEAITIREVGLIGQATGTSANNGDYNGLIERTVLDEPVTIPAGGTGKVTYTLKLAFPVA